MRILSRYVFRNIISSALLGIVLATFVIFLQQKVPKLFEVLVRSSAPAKIAAYLFALAMPPVLQLTIPFGVLVGILIGLGRMSSDGEITAMRAAGISSRRVTIPVLVFALIAAGVAAAASLWLAPAAIRESVRVINKLSAAQLTAEIQPRVFEEQFSNKNTILYVGEVKPGPVTLWRNVFLADLTPPENRATGLREKADGPRITVAREAIAVPDLEHNRIQLHMREASTHEVGKDHVADDTSYPRGDQALEAAPPAESHAPPYSEMDTRELRGRLNGPEWLDARIEWHRRWAYPFACIALALVGVPLGVSTRKGGKSSGYVVAVFLAFFCYHLSFMGLIGMARQQKIRVEAAVWLPNAAFLIAGLILLARLEQPGEHDLVGLVKAGFAGLWKRTRGFVTLADAPRIGPTGRLPLLPQIVDTYVLSSFLFYLALCLTSFVLLTEVYTFFDLLGDIVKNKIPMARVFTYLAFLTPKLIYDTLPVSVLVAVLVTFGILTKYNEVTAFKACGVSLRRLAMPILLVSGALSAGLFAFDHLYVPEANRKQDAIRNEIKNRPVQTYLRPDRKWIFGRGSRIYYYKYLDSTEGVMAGVSVYEIDPDSFQLRKQISAERAQWQPSLNTWIFQNGWSRDLRNNVGVNFQTYQATTFPELDEPPGYFLKEVKQYIQMDFRELDRYIGDLQQSGFDTVKLRVQFHKKFSVPLFALIMAMISVPFGFLVGNRGAMAGVGVSIGIAIVYLGVGLLFEQIGNVNQLPPAVAAWAPDALFSMAGLYLLLRMRS